MEETGQLKAASALSPVLSVYKNGWIPELVSKLCIFVLPQNVAQVELRNTAAVWFNKMCRSKHSTPKYRHITINGHKPQNINTKT